MLKIKIALCRFLPVCLFCAACNYDFRLPEEASLSCESDADCVTPRFCKTSLNRCVLPGLDEEAPALVSESTNITPAVARSGVSVHLRFSVSETLLEAPIVTLGTPTPVFFVLESQEGQDYVYIYTVLGQEGEGSFPLTISLVDLYGNKAEGLSLGSLDFDFSVPSITTPSTNQTHLNASSTGSIEFSAFEPLGSVPIVRLADGTPLVQQANQADDEDNDAESEGTHDYRFIYAPSGLESEGWVDVEIVLADVAGNSTTVSMHEVFYMDFSPPHLKNTVEVVSTIVRQGQNAVVQFEVSETLYQVPQVLLVGTDGSSLNMR